MLQLSIITSGSFVCRHNINKQINFFMMVVTPVYVRLMWKG